MTHDPFDPSYGVEERPIPCCACGRDTFPPDGCGTCNRIVCRHCRMPVGRAWDCPDCYANLEAENAKPVPL